MDFPQLHNWNLAPGEAVDLQRQLSRNLILQDQLPQKIETVAGIDVSCRLRSRLFHAAVVVLSYPQLQPIETATASMEIDFPYIPGLLSFRELPVILEAAKTLSIKPDLALVDGQGLAHPRGFGLACHLGLWLNLPAIGSAKSRLYGEHEDVAERKGSRTAMLKPGGEQIGEVLRSRDRVKPLYVSPGHLVDVSTATKVVLSCCDKYRLPEPIRFAHQACNLQRVKIESDRSA